MQTGPAGAVVVVGRLPYDKRRARPSSQGREDVRLRLATQARRQGRQSGRRYRARVGANGGPLVNDGFSTFLLAGLFAARAAKRAGALVCLNAAPADPLGGELATLVQILVVNAMAAEMLSVVIDDSLDSTRAEPPPPALSEWHRDCDRRWRWRDSRRTGWSRSRPSRFNVVSTYGAGDTLVGIRAVGIGLIFP